MRILRRGVEREFAVRGVVYTDRAARLDRVCGNAVVDQPNLGDVLRLGERGIRCGLVAKPNRPCNVAVRAIVPDFRRPGLRCLLKIDERGQRLVVHGDELGGVAGFRLSAGYDEGNMVADAADTVGQ